MPESIMFVPECHVDTALTRTLLLDRLSFINHKHGISNVAKALQSQAENGRGPRFVVGMVDRDKRFTEIKYFQRFTREVQTRTGPNCQYRIYQHPDQPSHFLIVLEPACDTWIFEAAHSAGLALADFGLPNTLAGFIDVVKDEDAEDNPQLRRLLHAIRQAQPSGYRELATFVADIMDTNSQRWQ
jgi:hypothetical protein